MIVTFISECQKNSLKLTRRVLDAYAHRIGERTWQSIMTEQGLEAVRTKLSRSARRTTAVACHRARGSRRLELLWVVGNRRRFDDQGNVPVNRTGRDLLREQDENDWQYLDVLKGIVAVAGLFHDFGKSWVPFQTMLRSSSKKGSANSGNKSQDPVRHEWISLLLFTAFARNRNDCDWLTEMAEFADQDMATRIKRSKALAVAGGELGRSKIPPFEAGCSPLASWIAWLIVSHHRLPKIELTQATGSHHRDEQRLLNWVNVDCGYEKTTSDQLDFTKHWQFKQHLPLLSQPWCKQAKRWCNRLSQQLERLGSERLKDLSSCQRLLLTLSRATLMLGDHQYSSKSEDKTWPDTYEIFANSYSRDQKENRSGKILIPKGTMRQRLDEHLVGVTQAALMVGHLLPSFEKRMPGAQNLKVLRKPSPPLFKWQNRAVEALRTWQTEHRINEAGFFAVNMASTGKGKTFANAKIMDAINPKGLRYSLALGLRTLTLQTGDEYREKMRLDTNELAVLIGSAAVRTLHEQRSEIASESGSALHKWEGAESSESLSHDLEFAYDDLVPDDPISTILDDPKGRQLLKSPILVCTIDHLMPAVESTRGGRQILPLLRLMSSDLVIDEVDDFDHSDMPAIARLVHLAGMLGRKVMISSATIPPSIAIGLFHAYREGWTQFARFRNRSTATTGFWVDEYSANTSRVVDDSQFENLHASFVNQRKENLKKEGIVKCRAKVREIDHLTPIKRRAGEVHEKATTEGSSKNLQEHDLKTVWFHEVLNSAVQLHYDNSIIDDATGKRFSVGIVRLANVDPCIDLAQYLLGCDLPADLELRIVCYHARQVLLLRSVLEQHLDDVLNRKSQRCPSSNWAIRRHLESVEVSNVLFVVVASPVAEVGRDHDYDWAVVEPSSMRSIIQMAGRVMRHRQPNTQSQTLFPPNIILPELNFRAFTTNDKAVFKWPGFEGGSVHRGGGYLLGSKSLIQLLDSKSIAERLDASSRITCPADLSPETNLAHLEHQVLRNILSAPNLSPGFVRGWTQCAYYLTDLAQKASRFRESGLDSSYKLHISDDESLQFRTVDPDSRISDGPQGKMVPHVTASHLAGDITSRLWLPLDYAGLVQRQQERTKRSRRSVCEFLGEIRLRDDDGRKPYTWIPDLGARRE